MIKEYPKTLSWRIKPRQQKHEVRLLGLRILYEPAKAGPVPLLPRLQSSGTLSWQPPKKRRQRGAALVEFALISSFLFLILFGIIEVGLILGDQAQVGEAAREAARSASVGSPTITAGTSAVNAGSSLHLTTSNVLLEKSLDGGTTWVLLGDTGTGVNDAVSGSLIRATVTYNHPLVTTLIFTGSTRLLTSKMVMQRE